MMIRSAKQLALLALTIFFTRSFAYAQNDSTKIRHSIIKIARKISKYPTVDRGPVGISGDVTKQFSRYIYLLDNATDAELVELTSNRSAKVKAYAFEALVSRSFKDIKQILIKHVSDTSVVNIREGCFSSTEQINLYFLHLLTLNIYDEVSNNKLTETEAQEIRLKMTVGKEL